MEQIIDGVIGIFAFLGMVHAFDIICDYLTRKNKEK